MGIQDVVRLVLPKEDHFFDFLERQAKLAHDGVRELVRLKTEPVEEVKEKVKAIEKEGDRVSHDLEDALARTFVTPLDREDLHKLSSLLDDILDRAHATASAFEMFSMDRPSAAAMALFDVLEQTTALLSATLPSLRKNDFERIRTAMRELKVLEKEGDVMYRKAMKDLFADASIDARSLIREKEVIELLEDAIDTCEDVAVFLANLAVKHG
jgi:predicted phosphate transport protein (TIGR00153 family)